MEYKQVLWNQITSNYHHQYIFTDDPIQALAFVIVLIGLFVDLYLEYHSEDSSIVLENQSQLHGTSLESSFSAMARSISGCGIRGSSNPAPTIPMTKYPQSVLPSQPKSVAIRPPSMGKGWQNGNVQDDLNSLAAMGYINRTNPTPNNQIIPAQKLNEQRLSKLAHYPASTPSWWLYHYSHKTLGCTVKECSCNGGLSNYHSSDICTCESCIKYRESDDYKIWLKTRQDKYEHELQKDNFKKFLELGREMSGT